MTHPLIARLTDEFSWPRFDTLEAVQDFVDAPGVHVLFVPGDPKRNLETADVAVILPELKQAFQGKFDCAVVADSIETVVRDVTKVFKTPSLIFYREGKIFGAYPKVRDWSDYVALISHILTPSEASAETVH